MSLKYLGLIAAFALVGCGSDGVTGGQGTVADLAGTWSMSRLELVNAVDTTERINPLQDGTSATLTVTPAGAFTFTVTIPAGGTSTETGTLHLRGGVLPDGVERDVFVAHGRITFEEQPGARNVVDGGWIVPGLVDVHAHLGVGQPCR